MKMFWKIVVNQKEGFTQKEYQQLSKLGYLIYSGRKGTTYLQLF
jgi:hypothetical protein